jgi:hypothetical protein
MIIIGAGLAGLLAANMLSHRHPVVYEAQSSLPNNHSAVLRFRTSQIGDITHIPFRRVTMTKCVVPYLNPVADALAYSFKNTNQYRSDRSINIAAVVEDRYIAPPTLIPDLAKNAKIEFNIKFEFNKIPNGPYVSTIPMPVLMKALNYPGPQPTFTYAAGTNIRARIKDCDAYISILVPDPRLPFSRISITGNEVVAECYQQTHDLRNTLLHVANIIGIAFEKFYDFAQHEQRYAKINPIDDDIRKSFMFWATDKFGIFSLGRYATWRPGLLLDDLVKDIRLIDGWISSANRYSVARHR